MLQELAARTGATAWAIASMLFFLGVWIAITIRVVRARREDMQARARLALEGDGDSVITRPSGGPRAERGERTQR